MPFYEYQCLDCRDSFIDLRQVHDRDKPSPCPQCGSKKIERKVSAFATGAGAATSDRRTCGDSGLG